MADAANGTVVPFYAPDSFWNTPIAQNAAIDPHSAQIVATSITPYSGSANFANGNDWGISLVYASPSDKMYSDSKSYILR